jgi:DNA-binding beta-propeller fold protein YncE
MGLMRLRVLLVAVLGVLCVVLALGAGSALAGYTYPLEGELAPAGGSFSGLEASSVAVDDANGDTYVAASGSGVVDVFETATGTEVAALDGSLTPAGSFGGGQVQVAANSALGDVYVLDSTDNVLDVFNSLGGYVCQITGSSTPSASECNGVAGSDTPAHGFSDPGGVAVDQATGDVYVVDAHHGVVNVFSSAGAYVRQLSLASILGGFSALSETYTRGVAVDGLSGDVFVADSGRDVVYEFDATGGYLTTWAGANTPAGSFGGGFVSVAADDVSGNVYVTESADRVTDVFDASGGYRAQFSSGNSRGVAVDQASGWIYVSNSGEGTVKIFGRVLVPDVVTGGASNLGVTSVTLNGSVNPEGVPITACAFEYGTEAGSYGQSVPCAASPGSGSAPVAVSADLSGLVERATYHYRLLAANANGESQGADAQVTMPSRPSIESAAATDVTPDSVVLRASINPHAAQTSYRFEYGTSTAYGASIPVPDGQIPSGLLDHTVAQHVSGLQPATTYHWRVLAQNVAGTIVGSDHTFVFDVGGAGLPDNRAYEMVTPVHKNASLMGNILFGFLPDLSGDGSRVVLPTLQCFGDVASCSVDGAPEGVSYEFSRGGEGWTATALLPATPEDANAINVALVSPDAGTALVAAPTPPAGEDDWYARRTDGSFVDIGPVSSPSAGPKIGFTHSSDVRGTSDLSHVVYKSQVYRWPFDETEQTNNASSLYEYAGFGNAAPELVAVSGGAGSTDLIGKCGAYLGSGSSSFGALSADGGTVFFSVRPCASGSGVNAGVTVPKEELFARVDGSRTVPLGERSPLECTSVSGCASSPVGDAEFQGASVDGSKAFFLDTQQLTDNASEDSHSGDSASSPGCSQALGVNGCNLYEYDMNAPTGRTLVAVSAGDSSGGGPRVQGLMAISADGSHVYFIAKGVLTNATNARGETARDGAENLYVFERDAGYPEGRVSFIASLAESEQEIGIGGRTVNWTTTGDFTANVTSDGRFLVFLSRAALTADASGAGGVQVFRYDALTGELERVSVGERGFNDNGNGGVGDAQITPPVLVHLGPSRGDPTMSDDGSRVFFESPVALTPGALDDVPIGVLGITKEYASNVYEWREGRVYLLSDGRDTTATGSPACGHLSSVCLLGVDSTGSNVFFTTADPLAAEDTDTQVDVYDARVCTGVSPCIAAPAAPPPPCEGEACHGRAPAPPGLAGAATSVFSGPGNLTPAPAPAVKAKAKKPTRRAHGKPRKKAKKHKQRAHGRAGRRAAARRAVGSGRGHGHTSSGGGK